MPRKFLRRHLPHHSEIANNRVMKALSYVVGNLFGDPRLWHLNRRRVAGGVALGAFLAFVPLPIQVLLAALLAVAFRVNLPSAVALVWLTNPLTMVPVMYVCYRIGRVILGLPPVSTSGDVTFEWFINSIDAIWQPLLVGCVLVGGFTSGASYFLVMELWRLHVVRRWKRRARLYRWKQLRKKGSNSPV